MLGFKMVGFIKQAVVAYVYGANTITDTYFIAWGFVSGISEAAVKSLLVSLVAIYTNIRIINGKEKAARLINGLIKLFLPLFAILSGIIFMSAPIFAGFLAPSYNGINLERLICFIRVLSPILIFGCIELIFGAISDSYKSFYVPRLQSFIYSVSIILGCLVLSKRFGIFALVIGQYFSSIVFVVLLVLSTKKYHSFYIVKVKEIPEIKSILLTAIPLFIGNSALQLNQIVDKSITSQLSSGAASALSYCHTLEQFVTNIMIVNIGNVMFANFAEFIANGEIDKVKVTLEKTLNFLIALLLGVSAVTLICAKDIVSIVYYRGSFNYDAVLLTSKALVGYSLSFVVVAVRDLIIKCLYAFKDTKSPMVATLISIVLNIFLSITLSKLLGIFGVAIATSISAVVGMIINSFMLKKHIKEYRFDIHIETVLKCIPGLIIIIVFCLVIQHLISLTPFSRFAISSVGGLLIYIIVVALFGVREVRELINNMLTNIKFVKKEGL